MFCLSQLKWVEMSLSSNLFPNNINFNLIDIKTLYWWQNEWRPCFVRNLFFVWAMNPVTFFFLPFSTSVRNVSLNLNVERSFSWKRMQNPSQGTHKIALWGKYTRFFTSHISSQISRQLLHPGTFRRNTHKLLGCYIKAP